MNPTNQGWPKFIGDGRISCSFEKIELLKHLLYAHLNEFRVKLFLSEINSKRN